MQSIAPTIKQNVVLMIQTLCTTVLQSKSLHILHNLSLHMVQIIALTYSSHYCRLFLPNILKIIGFHMPSRDLHHKFCRSLLLYSRQSITHYISCRSLPSMDYCSAEHCTSHNLEIIAFHRASQSHKLWISLMSIPSAEPCNPIYSADRYPPHLAPRR